MGIGISERTGTIKHYIIKYALIKHPSSFTFQTGEKNRGFMVLLFTPATSIANIHTLPR